MVNTETEQTDRLPRSRDIGRLVRLGDGEHTYVGRLYDKVGPASGASVLAWGLARPGYEKIEVSPHTDILIQFNDGDYARIRLDNPGDVRGATHEERRANNENELKWSLTNVGMQSDPSGPQAICLSLETIQSTALVIGEPLVLTSPEGASIKSRGTIEQIFVYDRDAPISEDEAAGKPETELLRDFRTAINLARTAMGPETSKPS